MNALGRLLAVGSEWGSYVAPIGGSAGRGLAREVAEEASEQLGRQGARHASRELKPVVIGENMRERVVPFAQQKEYLTINDFVSNWSMEANAAWIRRMMREGRRIIDIGPDFYGRHAGLREVSCHLHRHAYALERYLLKGYPNYERAFVRIRTPRGIGGGVPGLSRPAGSGLIIEPFVP